MELQSITKAEDPAGLETLDLFANTDHFNKWLFDTLAPYCKDNLLEIGSGIGNISSFLLKHFSRVSLSDLRAEYCEILHKKFDRFSQLQGIYMLDLSDKEWEKKYPELQNKFDTVFASNVVEHIEDDDLALQNCRGLLKRDGRVVILVPAYGWLYNGFDKELGHYRRYDKAGLRKVIEKNGFDVVHTQYFNAAGILGWWFSGVVLRKKILPKDQLTLYNKLIPLIRLADKLLMHQAGLSVIAVGKKT